MLYKPPLSTFLFPSHHDLRIFPFNNPAFSVLCLHCCDFCCNVTDIVKKIQNLNVDSINYGLTSGYPAHRAHSGEESECRGRAETSGHREPRPHYHGYGLLGYRHWHRRGGWHDELIHFDPHQTHEVHCRRLSLSYLESTSKPFSAEFFGLCNSLFSFQNVSNNIGHSCLLWGFCQSWSVATWNFQGPFGPLAQYPRPALALRQYYLCHKMMESVQENIECKITRRALLLNRGCCATTGSSPPLCFVSWPVATTVSYNRSISNLKKVGRHSDSDEKSSLKEKKKIWNNGWFTWKRSSVFELNKPLTINWTIRIDFMFLLLLYFVFFRVTEYQSMNLRLTSRLW